MFSLATDVESRVGSTTDADVEPIIDISLFPSDQVPATWTPVNVTPGGVVADLGAGSFGSSHVLLAYRRAVSSDVADTLPGYIVDICVVFADKGEFIPPNYVKVRPPGRLTRDAVAKAVHLVTAHTGARDPSTRG